MVREGKSWSKWLNAPMRQRWRAYSGPLQIGYPSPRPKESASGPSTRNRGPPSALTPPAACPPVGRTASTSRQRTIARTPTLAATPPTVEACERLWAPAVDGTSVSSRAGMLAWRHAGSRRAEPLRLRRGHPRSGHAVPARAGRHRQRDDLRLSGPLPPRGWRFVGPGGARHGARAAPELRRGRAGARAGGRAGDHHEL